MNIQHNNVDPHWHHDFVGVAQAVQADARMNNVQVQAAEEDLAPQNQNDMQNDEVMEDGIQNHDAMQNSDNEGDWPTWPTVEEVHHNIQIPHQPVSPKTRYPLINQARLQNTFVPIGLTSS